ncbi:hypothetical protein CY35_04G152500 [Sphagnum magellanicum]|nr:hypothetical protein CY35_04G152500 [Sphagnum magellanicum]
MERYLDEFDRYDSVWDTKPAWYTIALTRVFGMSVSWLLLHSVLLIAVVSVLESAWWFLFLYLYPLVRDSTWAAMSTTARALLESFFSLGIMLAKCTIAIVNHV